MKIYRSNRSKTLHNISTFCFYALMLNQRIVDILFIYINITEKKKQLYELNYFLTKYQ